MTGHSREYERTHPWINFNVSREVERAPWTLWYKLGRVAAYCEHISHTALRPDLAQTLHDVYLVKGVHATTAIEGNTLSEEQVKSVIDGATLKPSKEYLAHEVRNVLAGFNSVTEDLRHGHVPELSSERICEINRQVLEGMDVDDHVTPGELRLSSVGVANYRGAPAEDLPYLVKQMCDWLNGPAFGVSEQGNAWQSTFLKAILAHLYVAWIHPFGDGNGRTARMVEFQILVSAGVPSPAAHLLSNHYNATRDMYYRQLDRSSKVPGGQVVPFIDYALQGLLDGLEEQLEVMRADLERLVWRDIIDEVYGYNCSKTDQRRKRLACHLFDHEPDGVSATALLRKPEVAVMYADKTSKTLSRDLNGLLQNRLVTKEGTRWRARHEIVLGLRPEAQF